MAANNAINILIVDDTSVNIALLEAILQQRDYGIFSAANGDEALRIAREKRPNLILLDIMMPGMDGYAVCRRLKAERDLAHIPVIFISAVSGIDDKVRAFKVGGVDYISKPFQGEEVLARIETQLELLRLRESDRRFIAELNQEIIERKKLEAQLRQSEQHFRTMADTAPVLICQFDEALNGRYFNQVWRDFTGYSLQDALGAGWQSTIHPDHLKAFWPLFETAFKAQERFNCEIRMLRADGAVCWMIWNMVPLHRSNGEFEGYIGSCIDVTDIKTAQQQMLEYQLQKERIKLISGFVQDFAHEFRTPLATINASAYVMLRSIEEAKQQQQYARIRQEIDTMSNLLDTMLEMLRLDSTVFLAEDEVDFNLLIKTLADTIHPKLYAKQLQLELQLNDGLPLVWGDRQRLQNALIHILHNAIQYTPENGQITIKTAFDADQIYVQVQDTGIGMQEEIQQRIFEEFYREDQARPHRGFGLGLPIAKRIIDLHGGQISVVSHFGKGSTFIIAMPFARGVS